MSVPSALAWAPPWLASRRLLRTVLLMALRFVGAGVPFTAVVRVGANTGVAATGGVGVTATGIVGIGAPVVGGLRVQVHNYHHSETVFCGVQQVGA